MKILIIDDSTLSRNILKRSIPGEHQFVEAADGMRGLELYFLEHPDIVFLDLTMPGVNGLDVLGQIRSIDPNARVIIGSADIQSTTRQQAHDLGAAAFLSKPFTPDSVRDALQQVTGGSRTSSGEAGSIV